MFLSRISGANGVVMKIQFSVSLIFIMRGSGFGGLELMTIIVMVGGLMPVTNS